MASIVRKKERILLVSPVYASSFSGAAYSSQLLRDSALANAFELSHLNTRFVNSVAELETVTPAKALLFLKYLGQLVLLLITQKPDWVIINPAFSSGAFLKDAIYTLICARLFRRKVIWWAQAWGFRQLYTGSVPIVQQFIRSVSSSAYRIVTVGHAQFSDFDFICPRGQLFAIHQGIPAVEYPSRHFDERNETHVLYFSNLDASKGWRVLLKSATRICASCERVFFDFYGNPTADSSKESIMVAMQQSGYSDRIKYHGFAYGDDKRRAYEQADIFCFPSFFRHETFGLVNLEAMNAALPIVTTSHANIPEVVIDGQGGLLVPKEDEVALANALWRLVEDRGLRQRMGNYNQRRFYEYFTAEKFADRWIEFMDTSSN